MILLLGTSLVLVVSVVGLVPLFFRYNRYLYLKYLERASGLGQCCFFTSGSASNRWTGIGSGASLSDVTGERQESSSVVASVSSVARASGAAELTGCWATSVADVVAAAETASADGEASAEVVPVGGEASAGLAPAVGGASGGATTSWTI